MEEQKIMKILNRYRKFTVKLLLSLLLILGNVSFAVPQFLGQIAHAVSSWSVDASFPDNTCISTTFQCKTIQAAVTAAIGGDTINVAAGIYNESLNITKPVTLQSVGGEMLQL